MQKKKILKILHWIITIFLVLILAFNLYTMAAKIVFKNDLPKVFGFAQVIVISGSMEPAVRVGDLLFLREMDSYAVGDIVCFRADSKLVTHRIVEINGDQVFTKGDVNNVVDKPIQLSQIEGKVVLRVPRAGDIMLFMRTAMGNLLLIIAAILIIEVPFFMEKIKMKGSG